MVLIAGDIAIRAIFNLARRVSGPVPDRFAFAVGVPCSFHLIGGGCRSPEKVLGEAGGGDLSLRNCAGNLRLSGSLPGSNLLAGEQSATNDHRVLEKTATVHGKGAVAICSHGIQKGIAYMIFHPRIVSAWPVLEERNVADGIGALPAGISALQVDLRGKNCDTSFAN